MAAKPSFSKLGQLELPLARIREPDRNAALGGRSFYFFDFDDNVAFLTTPIILFHKETGEELLISSGEFARYNSILRKQLPNPYPDFVLDLCDKKGSFQRFRDRNTEELSQLLHNSNSNLDGEPFVEDLMHALGLPDVHWKGPSWSCFLHACVNQRPLALITARGHSPETMQYGLDMLVHAGHLPARPNYLGIFPVMHPEVRRSLGDNEFILGVPELKKAAIRRAVEKAIEVYGENPFHRFGMSDDDPSNIELITQEMTALKLRYPSMSFFVIETTEGGFTKWEIHQDHVEATLCANARQIDALEQLTFWP